MLFLAVPRRCWRSHSKKSNVIMVFKLCNHERTKILQFGESQMKRTCFLSLVTYIIRDIVTASLLMNVFRSCFSFSAPSCKLLLSHGKRFGFMYLRHSSLSHFFFWLLVSLGVKISSSWLNLWFYDFIMIYSLLYKL